MKTYFDFEGIADKAQREYERKLKYIKYWKKVEKVFKKQAKAGVQTFTKEFKHNPFSDIILDSESTIEGIAAFYGYTITDEKLGSKISTYTFTLKS